MTGDSTARETDLTAESSRIGRLRGRAFEAVTFGATVFGLVAVLALLVYVANDAFRPLTADPGWHATYLVAVVVPTVGLAGYYVTRDRTAGEVAAITLGIPVVGSLVAGAFVVLFLEILDPVAWFGLVVGLLVAAGVVYGHRRARTEAPPERLAVFVLAPLLSMFGLPSISVDFAFVTPAFGQELFRLAVTTPALFPGVPDVVTSLPVLPADWLIVALTLTVPAASGAGWLVGGRRESRRDGRIALGIALLGSIVAAAGGALAGVGGWVGVVIYTTTVVPLGVYVEDVVRRGDGVSGFLLPAVLVAGVVVGTLAVEAFGFAGPDAWLDWGFLTSAHSRTPSKAGIYPPLVGSVLMLVVIVVGVFPVGVGAAIYLEEYAPSSGRWGALVTFIEINIGNLAGVPSVVYGLLGLALFVRGVGFESGIVIVGGLTVGLLVLPIVIISAQEAIRSVPDSMRQASYGMGATRWQTTRNVVLPEALPGIMTGTILALGRAIGETAPLLMIGAAAVVRTPPNGFFSRFGAMPRQIFSWASEIQPEFRFGVLAAGVVTLLVVLLVMNGSAILVRNRYQRRR